MIQEEYDISDPQYKVLTASKPLILVMAGQRGGKTYGIGLRSAIRVTWFPKVPGMIAANTYLQLTQSTMAEVRKVWAKDFGYLEYDRRSCPGGAYVVNKQPPAHFKRFMQFDDYLGIVSFKNGAVIFTASLDNYSAHDGKTLGWCELDETKDTKEIAVKQVVLARLSYHGLYIDSEGDIIYSEKPVPGYTAYNPCIFNTSPSEGVVEWLINLFDLKRHEDYIEKHIMNPDQYIYIEEARKAICIYSTHWNQKHLAPGYIENRLDQLTEIEAKKFIYAYPFSASAALYYPYFESVKHVTRVDRIPGRPDHLAYDFNLVPYMTLVCSQIAETDTEVQIRIYKEYCLKPPGNTTEDVTRAYEFEHTGEIADVFYYGDAMGTRGVEGFGDRFTRFDDVRKVLRKYIGQMSDRTVRHNPGLIKRRTLVNKILAGKFFIGNKKVVLLIDHTCEETIRDFRYLKIGLDGKLKEKVTDKETGRTYEKLGHTSDAIEYLLAYLFEKDL